MSTTFQVSDVEELLAVMEQWGVAELHLTVEEASLDLVRATHSVTEVAGTAPSTTFATAISTDVPITEPELTPMLIHAPVVGVFHLATRGFDKGGPQVGEQVQAGQIIGSIELMHVPTDLVSPVSGTIGAILVEDGSGVEYGQPLMAIHPFEEVSEDEAGMLPPPTR